MVSWNTAQNHSYFTIYVIKIKIKKSSCWLVDVVRCLWRFKISIVNRNTIRGGIRFIAPWSPYKGSPPNWRALNPTPHISSLLKQKLKKLKHNKQQEESKSFGYTRIQNPILLNLLLGREVIQWMVIEEKKQEGMRLGRYELGRTLGEGNFGKVKFAQDLDSGLPFAVKILEKNRIIHLKITDQVFPSFILLFYFFFLKKKKQQQQFF